MQNKRKKINESDFERIILSHMFGMKKRAIAEEIGCGTATVERVLKAYEIVKTEDTEAAMDYAKHGYSVNYLEYAAKKFGTVVPQQVIEVANAYKEEQAAMQRERTAAKKKPAEESLPVEENLPADVHIVAEPYKELPKAQNNDILYLCKILEALAKTNELLETLMDVVIPKYVNDLKDNINVNADILSEQLKNSDAKLEKVVINTRKRGT